MLYDADKLDQIKKLVEKKRLVLSKLPPLSGVAEKRLTEWWDCELTYSSNAIEGNTLTRSETALVLEKGTTIAGKPLKDHMEALDHKEALQFVRSMAKERDFKIFENDILMLHKLVLQKSNAPLAGAYSNAARSISGSLVELPAPELIPGLMKHFSEWLFRQEDTPQTAFDAHLKLVTIHPFADGNGRTARLLMNLVLLRGGYPPLIIEPEHRPDYISSLQDAQLRNNKRPYDLFMYHRLAYSLDSSIKRIKPTRTISSSLKSLLY